MFDIAEVKTRGREAFKKNYWPCVGASILLSIVTAGSAWMTTSQANSSSIDLQTTGLTNAETAALAMALLSLMMVSLVVSVVLHIFLSNPLKVGCNRFFKANVENPPASFGTISEGFGNYLHVFLTLFLSDLFIALWSLLLIVPGVMKAYSYRLVPFIIKDNPELGSMEVLKRSEEMMKGNRWQAFLFDLSFLGWWLLSAITLNIAGVFYVQPYYNNANAALYLSLRDQR